MDWIVISSISALSCAKDTERILEQYTEPQVIPGDDKKQMHTSAKFLKVFLLSSKRFLLFWFSMGFPCLSTTLEAPWLISCFLCKLFVSLSPIIGDYYNIFLCSAKVILNGQRRIPLLLFKTLKDCPISIRSRCTADSCPVELALLCSAICVDGVVVCSHLHRGSEHSSLHCIAYTI